MTRDELRERIARELAEILNLDWNLMPSFEDRFSSPTTHEGLRLMANRILALLPPQPKLEWQPDPRHPDVLNLWVGQLYGGEVRPRNGKFEGISYILGMDIRAQDVGIEEAKAAVEEAIRSALAKEQGL